MGFDLRERAASFYHAGRGILLMVRSQHNAWIHLLATAGVIIAGYLTVLSRLEWCALVFAFGLVWVAEALNTALEFLADEVSMAQRERLGNAKDAGAGGVLLAAIAAAVIGLIVFVPHWIVALEVR
jgi:diacylglycerol kinase (ATP)